MMARGAASLCPLVVDDMDLMGVASPLQHEALPGNGQWGQVGVRVHSDRSGEGRLRCDGDPPPFPGEAQLTTERLGREHILPDLHVVTVVGPVEQFNSITEMGGFR